MIKARIALRVKTIQLSHLQTQIPRQAVLALGLPETTTTAIAKTIIVAADSDRRCQLE